MEPKNVTISKINRYYNRNVIEADGIALYVEYKSEITPQPYRIKTLMTYFCVSGEVTLSINGVKKCIKAPSFVTYIPESIIEEESISHDFCCLIMVLDKPLLLSLPIIELPDILYYMACNPVIPLDAKMGNQPLLNAYQMLCDIASMESPTVRKSLAYFIAGAVYHPRSLFSIMTSKERRDVELPNIEWDSQLVNKCIEMIRQDCCTERFVPYYAKALNVSSSMLNLSMKKWTGRTVTDYIHESLMWRAEVLLLASRDSIKDIAYTLMFKSPAHFVNFFKKKKGVAPEQYRYSVGYWINPNIKELPEYK